MNRTFKLLAVALMAACSEAGPLDLEDGAGPPELAKGKPPAEPTAEVTITTTIAGAGLYGDGGGFYHGVFNGGNLWISPSCEESRQFILDLRGQDLPDPFNDPVTGCGFPPRLTIEEGLIGASVGDILGTAVPAGSTNMGSATNYYFTAGGNTYNVIWQGGIRVTGVTANGDGTTTYTLSTDPDLADDSDLVRRKTQGKPGTEPVDGGDVIAHLDLVVKVIPAAN